MAREKLSRGEIWEMVRQFPEYVDGRLDDARAEKIVESFTRTRMLSWPSTSKRR